MPWLPFRKSYPETHAREFPEGLHNPHGESYRPSGPGKAAITKIVGELVLLSPGNQQQPDNQQGTAGQGRGEG